MSFSLRVKGSITTSRVVSLSLELKGSITTRIVASPLRRTVINVVVGHKQECHRRSTTSTTVSTWVSLSDMVLVEKHTPQTLILGSIGKRSPLQRVMLRKGCSECVTAGCDQAGYDLDETVRKRVTTLRRVTALNGQGSHFAQSCRSFSQEGVAVTLRGGPSLSWTAVKGCRMTQRARYTPSR